MLGLAHSRCSVNTGSLPFAGDSKWAPDGSGAGRDGTRPLVADARNGRRLPAVQPPFNRTREGMGFWPGVERVSELLPPATRAGRTRPAAVAA